MKISFIDLFYHKVLQFSREVINFLTKKQQPAAGCHKDRMPLVGKSKLEYMVLWCGELLSVCPLCSASYHPQRGCSMKSAVKKNRRRGFAQGLLPRAESPFQRPACALPLGRRRIAMQPAFPFYPILPHFACHATRTRCGARFQVQGSPTPKHAVALPTLQRPAVFWLTVNLLFVIMCQPSLAFREWQNL